MLTESSVEDVRAVAGFFRKVDYPARALHSETRKFLEDFFRNGGFVTLCRRIFGPLDEYVADEEVCWMEQCDAAPAGPLAAALSALVAPDCPFVTLLEAFSTPPSDAVSRLRGGGWKDGRDVACVDYRVNLRLSTLMTQSHRLLAEPDDTDLYVLPRARCPALLLVPFWQPPLLTCASPESATGQMATSLPCTPLAYFLVRLLQYAMRRARQATTDGNASAAAAASFVVDPPAVSIVSWLGRLAQRAMALVTAPRAVDFPFHSRIVTAFVQRYVTPSLRLRMPASAASERFAAVWTTGDVTAMLLTLLPFTLCHRHIAQPLSEASRTAVTDMTALSQLLSMVPVMTELYICHHGAADDDGAAEESSSAAGPQSPTMSNISGDAPGEDYCDDAKATAGNDLRRLTTTLYRCCLITLREALLSLTNVPYCRAMHCNNALELWLTLMQPGWRRRCEPDEDYVRQHYEAYSCVVEDVWGMLQQSAFLARLDGAGALLLERCLRALCHPAARELAGAVHGEASRRGMPALSGVTRYFVLNWRQGEGQSVGDIRGAAQAEMAAEVCLAFERQGRAMHGDVAGCLQRCMQLLHRLVPSLARRVEQRRAVHDSASAPHQTSYNFTRGTRHGTARKGGAQPMPRFYYKRRYSTAASQCVHNEVPMLVAVTSMVDEVVECVLTWWYDSSIPRCDAGHRMRLIESTEACVCCRHETEGALWQCALCGTAYGSCCRPLPRGCVHGEALHRVIEDEEGRACAVCGAWLDVTQRAVYAGEGKQWYCAACASRPYRPWTARWLASYTVVTCITTLALCVLVVYLLW